MTNSAFVLPRAFLQLAGGPRIRLSNTCPHAPAFGLDRPVNAPPHEARPYKCSSRYNDALVASFLVLLTALLHAMYAGNYRCSLTSAPGASLQRLYLGGESPVSKHKPYTSQPGSNERNHD